MKRRAERRVRELLSEDGFAQPDGVEYGPRSITLFWHSAKKAITVDVTDEGEVGESRAGPPSPLWSRTEPADTSRVVRLATLREKRAAEQSTRAMLDDHGLPQPDQVQYGATCIRLLWHEQRFVLIVDIDGPRSTNREGEEVLNAALARLGYEGHSRSANSHRSGGGPAAA